MAYIGVQPADAYTSFAVQHFTTSATTSYTLDNPVANENEIALFINNVRQEPGSSYAYTASGTALTLSAATSASDTMYCVFIGKAVQTVTPTLPIANFSSTGIDDNATSTAVTLDSSGNVLVGTTDNSLYNNSGAGNGGVMLANTADGGRIDVAREGVNLILNRLASDGLIQEFKIDGTTIGSISSSPNFNIQRTSGAGFNFGTTNISPLNSGVLSDNTIDLGFSSYRWNDLYLGGNIYLGGTGSANALDDYEEGTWTPTFGGAGSDPSSVSWNIQSGTYTKVGNKVFARAIVYPSSFSGGSGNWNVRSLPFTANANSVGTMMWDRIRIQASYPGGLVPRVLNNTTYMEFPEMNDASDEASNRIQVDDLAGNFYLELSIVYTTNS